MAGEVSKYATTQTLIPWNWTLADVSLGASTSKHLRSPFSATAARVTASVLHAGGVPWAMPKIGMASLASAFLTSQGWVSKWLTRFVSGLLKVVREMPHVQGPE